ncbi:lysosomal acid lipase/cholesteryl ester hydrolase-like [Elgaria multicarinata webbii]|uniref:lysosomal acid lipase/cholesteryl ester hydrolase-like n=1 Tax=Elgaria multicarinata webbii TaxID=159646 RepID=UPI002FCD243B
MPEVPELQKVELDVVQLAQRRKSKRLEQLKMLGFIIVACFCQGIFRTEAFKIPQEPVTKYTLDPECFLNVTEIIHYHGYPSEEYQVETEDGYILTVDRIPRGRYNDGNKGPRPAVFLQHCVLGDASLWISNQPNNSLGFILADAGYDVWLGNSRGNMWSSKHKTLDPKKNDFWKFSFHEMGYYDIPAVIYFILDKTGQQQLSYVGYSEGTTIGFIAFSSWPKLAERVKVFFALGPITTITFATTPLVKLGRLPPSLFRAILGNKELFQFSLFLRKLLAAVCSHQPKLCAGAINFLAGENIANLNMSRFDMYMAHFPAGTSIQNGLHWHQLLNGKVFRAYDHGSEEKNMAKYNQTTPPVYKVEDIKTPIAYWTGGRDLLVHPNDVAALRLRIKNLIYEKHIPEWQHLDFIIGLDATERMYMKIMEIMTNI